MSIRTTPEYKHLMALIAQVGATNRADRLSLASDLLDEEIKSFTDLTEEQIHILISKLDDWRKIQIHRWGNQSLLVESLMISELHENYAMIDNKDSILSTPQSRREFIKKMAKKHFDVSEENYTANLGDFQSKLTGVTSKLKHTNTDETIYVNEGRWDDWQVIPAPATSLGLALGVGGIPRGKVVHVWGKKHAGKSMLSYQIAAESIKAEIPTVIIDAEAALDGKFATRLGVDVDSEYCTVVRPASLEDALDIIRGLSTTGATIIVDSISTLFSEVDLEKDLRQSDRVGGTARLWIKTLGTIRTRILNSGATIILINQVRSNFEAGMYESKKKAWGSEGIQHQVDVSINVSKVKEDTNFLRERGFSISRLRFDKNRFSNTSETVVDLSFKPGNPYRKDIDVVKACGTAIDSTVKLTYGEMADNVLLKNHTANIEDPKQVSSTKNRYALRVDPYMARAILEDEPDFTDVAVEPMSDEEFNKLEGSVPPVDTENYEYMTIPGLGEGNAIKWAIKHPSAIDVISERLLDGLNSRDRLLAELDDLNNAKRKKKTDLDD